MKKTENIKISAQTLIRTIVLAVTLANTILTALGKNPLPFAEDELYSLLSSIATLFASVWAWWKNNSFTDEAIKADEILKEMRK